jgi:hypothetical protein
VEDDLDLLKGYFLVCLLHAEYQTCRWDNSKYSLWGVAVSQGVVMLLLITSTDAK